MDERDQVVVYLLRQGMPVDQFDLEVEPFDLAESWATSIATARGVEFDDLIVLQGSHR
jgi:hypothetical protein